MTTSVKLGRTTKIRQNFFFIITFSPFSSTPNNKNSPEFFCAFGSFNHSHVSSLAMVQPVSPILILIGLGFRLYSRQSITYGSTRPRFIRLRSYASRVLFVPSIHPSISFVASTSFRPRQYHSSFLALLGVPCIQCSRWV
jgi:hypothetical protein